MTCERWAAERFEGDFRRAVEARDIRAVVTGWAVMVEAVRAASAVDVVGALERPCERILRIGGVRPEPLQ